MVCASALALANSSSLSFFKEVNFLKNLINIIIYMKLGEENISRIKIKNQNHKL